MSEVGLGSFNNWSLQQNTPKEIDLSSPYSSQVRDLMKDPTFLKKETDPNPEAFTLPKKEESLTRPTPSSAGFNPSGISFDQPARELSKKEASKMLKEVYKSEIKELKDSAQQGLYDKFGETTTNVTAGIAAVAVTGKVGGSTNVAGAKVSGELDFRKKSSNLGVSTKMGDVDVSANVQVKEGSSPVANLRASTNIKGFDVSASVSSAQEGSSKTQAGVFIKKEFRF